MSWFDAHCHVGKGLLNGMDENVLLAKMERLEIQRAIIVPWDQAIAVENYEGNAYVAKLAAKHGERLIAFCTVNPWFGKKALDEIARAVAGGARGLKLHPVYQGFQLNDPIVLPIVEKAITLGLPIYIPTGTPVSSLPLQLKYVADLYPEGTFIQGHFGSTDFWIDAVPSVLHSPNIFVDTAYNVPSAIENIIRLIGADRVIFSSDAPYLSLESEVEKLQELHISEEDRRKIGYENIEAILQKGAKS